MMVTRFLLKACHALGNCTEGFWQEIQMLGERRFGFAVLFFMGSGLHIR
jgi:hypothetical protein